jgi:hypothetical protein
VVWPRSLLVNHIQRHPRERARRYEVQPGIARKAQGADGDAHLGDAKAVEALEYAAQRTPWLDLSRVALTALTVEHRKEALVRLAAINFRGRSVPPGTPGRDSARSVQGVSASVVVEGGLAR